MAARATKQTQQTPTPTQASTPTTDTVGNSRRAANAQTTGTDGADALKTSGEPPTKEELDAKIAKAKTDGSSKGTATAQAVDAGAAKAKGDEKKGDADKKDGQADAKAADGQGAGAALGDPKGGPGGPGDAKGADPHIVPTFGQGTGKINWDVQVAEHDSFGSAATQAPVATPKPSVDRGDLVLKALGSGAASGLAQGLTSATLDTAINLASTKIPYLAGFVEIGKGAYAALNGDFGKWAGQMGGGLMGGGNFGKAAANWQKGGLVDRIEAVVDVGAGIKKIIDTLSSICWIVAGLGFVLSWIPGMQWLIPFVALSAKWASVLGLVGTASGALLSIFRLLVMTGRSLEILLADASPDELVAKAESLRANTEGFTKSLTERGANKARGAVGNRIAASRGTNPKATPPAEPTQGSSGGRLQKARSLIAEVAFGSKAINKDGRTKLKEELTNTAGATASTTKDAVTGKNHTGDRINNLEARGISVYHSAANRSKTQARLAKAKTPDPSSAQGKAKAQQDLTTAQTKADAASAARSKTLAAKNDAAAKAKAAQDAYNATKGKAPSKAQVDRAEIDAKGKALLRSWAKQDVDALQKQAATQEKAVSMAKVAVAKGTADPKAVTAAQRAYDRTQSQLTRAKKDLAELTTTSKAAADRHQALKKQVADANTAYTNATMAKGQSRLANDAHAKTTTQAKRAQGTLQQTKDAQAAQAPKNDAAAANQQTRFDAIANHDRKADLTGSGADGGHLYGQNQGSGTIGALTGFILDETKLNKKIDAGIQKGIGTHDWDPKRTAAAKKTADAKTPAKVDAKTDARADGALDGKKDAKDPLPQTFEQMLQQMWQALPPPPTHAPLAVDGAALAHDALVKEETKLQAQLGTIDDTKKVGQQSLTELDGAKKMAATGKDAATQLQVDADAKKAKQAQVSSEGAKITQTSGQASGEAGKSGGLLSQFLGPFLELMGKIPARFVGNAGSGSSGANKLQTMSTDSTNAATLGQTAGADAQAQATTWQASTDAAKTKTQSTATTLQSADATVQGLQADTQGGMTDLDASKAEIKGHLDLIAAEKARLIQEQATQQGVIDQWSTTHAQGVDTGVAAADDMAKKAGGGP